ncbi:hypothetical protein D3873_10630 [Paenisporosarcina cavernae]|uniref:Uncharacterized protein n=2 Tax=Paenisporosarcina cavernae TaxID=2320858 RepID=A0A385YWJ0_9BACL|nr:hypothetical protein D3873_10630 [Paenisporosarcina cavernae]
MAISYFRNNIPRNTDLEKTLSSKVDESVSNEINLHGVTEFQWTQAYLFEPYTSQETMNQQIGIKFTDSSNISQRDDIYLLVFVNDDEIVQYAEVKRHQSDFSIKQSDILTPENSIITITKHS